MLKDPKTPDDPRNITDDAAQRILEMDLNSVVFSVVRLRVNTTVNDGWSQDQQRTVQIQYLTICFFTCVDSIFYLFF